MDAIRTIDDHERYARCIRSSRKVRWDIDKDFIRGRLFDTATKFHPDSLSLADEAMRVPANMVASRFNASRSSRQAMIASEQSDPGVIATHVACFRRKGASHERSNRRSG